MNRKFVSHHLSPVVLLVVFVLAARAQQQPNALMTGMAVNTKQLKQYTFKQRTETYHKGELKNAKTEEVHYNVGGERVNVPLDEQKAESERPPRGPGSRIIAKKIEQEKEKMKEHIERLMALTGRYLSPDPARLETALARAEVTKAGGSTQVRILMRDYVQPRDTMTMTFDAATKRPMKTEVSTALDESPVSIVLAFDQIREGPNYPGKTVIRSDAKQLELRVYTYDYRL